MRMSSLPLKVRGEFHYRFSYAICHNVTMGGGGGRSIMTLWKLKKLSMSYIYLIMDGKQ